MTLFQARDLAARLGPAEALTVDGDKGTLRLVLQPKEGPEVVCARVPFATFKGD